MQLLSANDCLWDNIYIHNYLYIAEPFLLRGNCDENRLQCRYWCCGLQRRVDLQVNTDVSEELTASTSVLLRLSHFQVLWTLRATKLMCRVACAKTWDRVSAARTADSFATCHVKKRTHTIRTHLASQFGVAGPSPRLWILCTHAFVDLSSGMLGGTTRYFPDLVRLYPAYSLPAYADSWLSGMTEPAVVTIPKGARQLNSPERYSMYSRTKIIVHVTPDYFLVRATIFQLAKWPVV
jgi:hypothetical protein